jgi:hypothetical protein
MTPGDNSAASQLISFTLITRGEHEVTAIIHND